MDIKMETLRLKTKYRLHSKFALNGSSSSRPGIFYWFRNGEKKNIYIYINVYSIFFFWIIIALGLETRNYGIMMKQFSVGIVDYWGLVCWIMGVSPDTSADRYRVPVHSQQTGSTLSLWQFSIFQKTQKAFGKRTTWVGSPFFKLGRKPMILGGCPNRLHPGKECPHSGSENGCSLNSFSTHYEGMF